MALTDERGRASVSGPNTHSSDTGGAGRGASALPLLSSRPRESKPPSNKEPEAWLRNCVAPTGYALRVYLWLKRAFDLVLASAALLMLCPVFAVVALFILLEDRGPILFSQMRVGKNGKTFRFYKFRSMVANAEAIKAKLAVANEAEGPIFKMKNDPRITRIGRFIRKWSLDELPQFINVLRGEMSIVGPRPHLPSEVEKYAPHQKKRLTVQPGLLCLREACGRSKLSFERWVELDLLYIETRSLPTDIRILLRTIPAIFRAEGAY